MIRPAQVADAALFMATLDPNATLEEMTLMPARRDALTPRLRQAPGPLLY